MCKQEWFCSRSRLFWVAVQKKEAFFSAAIKVL